MDKQIVNIKLLENGDIQSATWCKTPTNKVLSLNADVVEILANGKYRVSMNTKDYFLHALWERRMCLDHGSVETGYMAIHTGYEHKSIPALIMGTKRGQKVGYRDGNKFNLRRDNLYIRGKKLQMA